MDYSSQNPTEANNMANFVVTEWPAPRIVKKLKRFLGLRTSTEGSAGTTA